MSALNFMCEGKVTKCAWDNDGNPVGRAHDNPILDTREYVVELRDETQAELAVNLIAGSMCAQCDPDGNVCAMFDCWGVKFTAVRQRH